MKRKTKTLIGLGIILAVCIILAVAFAGFSGAHFGDQVGANGNTTSAATLELNVDGSNTAGSTFAYTNVAPDAQLVHRWPIQNVGSITGYLDLENLGITQDGGAFMGPEAKAGDTANAGNLGDLLNAVLFWDKDNDGYFSAGDVKFYEGSFSAMPTSFDQSLPVAAGATTHLEMITSWYSGAESIDNKGQGDTMVFNLTFELDQTAGQ